MQRILVNLNPKEWSDFHDLRHPDDVWSFWRAVARARGLDWHSLLSLDGTVNDMTALPLGHGKHWCWPHALKCKHKPQGG